MYKYQVVANLFQGPQDNRNSFEQRSRTVGG